MRGVVCCLYIFLNTSFLDVEKTYPSRLQIPNYYLWSLSLQRWLAKSSQNINIFILLLGEIFQQWEKKKLKLAPCIYVFYSFETNKGSLQLSYILTFFIWDHLPKWPERLEQKFWRGSLRTSAILMHRPDVKFDVEPYKNGSVDIIISLVTQYITGKENIFPLFKLTYARFLNGWI